MYRKKLAKTQAVINTECRRIEGMLARSGGSTYIIDKKHPFLWWSKWLWSLSDRDEMLQLLECPMFNPQTPGYQSRELITTLRRFLMTTRLMPVIEITSDPSIPKSTHKFTYLEELRQWLLPSLDKSAKEHKK